MNMMNKEPERHEIEALLPWHAAGTLNRRDADRVEQALAGDRELRRRFDIVREELSETIHLNETLGAPSSAGHGETVRRHRRRGRADADPPRVVRLSPAGFRIFCPASARGRWPGRLPLLRWLSSCRPQSSPAW